MFSSVKTKIIFFITLILIITATLIIYFTDRDVGDAILEVEEKSAQNILRMVELNISTGYNQLLSNKIDSILTYQKHLKLIAGISLYVLEEAGALYESGLVAKEAAIESVKKRLISAKLNQIELIVFDIAGTVIIHSNPSFIGMSIEDLKDMKSRKISAVMSEDVLSDKGDYSVFMWKNLKENLPTKKLGYFIPFHKWKWTLGIIIDINHIESDASKRLNNIIEELNITFSKIHIAKTGSAFLFNGKKEVLIAPKGFGKEQFKLIINTKTGNQLLVDLMNSVKSKKTSIQYTVSPKNNAPLMEGLVTYFKALDWYIGTTVPFKEVQLPAKKLVTKQIYIILSIFILTLFFAYLIVSRISKPLKILSSYAKDLPSMDFTIGKNDEVTPIDELPKKFKDEVGQLAESFLFMKTELKKNIKALMDTTATKERFESELNVAREIQLGVIPKIFPPFPDCFEFELYATLLPAKEIGGDLYDFFFIDDEHLCFTLGDVSDKSIPAALFMMITRTLIRTVAQKGRAPSEVMSIINNILCTDNPRSMFVTLIIGILDINNGELIYCNGGHNPPIVLSNKFGVSYKRDISGLLVGAMEDIPYNDIKLVLEKGDSFFLYTDGVTEAMDTNKNIFSEERLLSEVELLKDLDITTIIKNIMIKIKEHASGTSQSDDIAMMMIKYKGKQ
ncbi:MAG: SpoIIE family protein phosphatase [Desulfobacterales bacterium]|nr:SpoIIE family protein phosphatase [Desulfobacterales bacterium]